MWKITSYLVIILDEYHYECLYAVIHVLLQESLVLFKFDAFFNI